MMKKAIGISNGPEEMGKVFDIFPLEEGETDEEAIQRAKNAYFQDLEVYIVEI